MGKRAFHLLCSETSVHKQGPRWGQNGRRRAVAGGSAVTLQARAERTCGDGGRQLPRQSRSHGGGQRRCSRLPARRVGVSADPLSSGTHTQSGRAGEVRGRAEEGPGQVAWSRVQRRVGAGGPEAGGPGSPRGHAPPAASGRRVSGSVSALRAPDRRGDQPAGEPRSGVNGEPRGPSAGLRGSAGCGRRL